MNDCLVLDAASRPIGIVGWERAVKLYWEDEAVIVAEDAKGKVLHSQKLDMGLPRVIRLKNYIAKNVKKNIAPSRYNVAIRDSFRCQYCGLVLDSVKEQTLDHVIPSSRGGKNTWENLVLACVPCNRCKGDKTPDEAGMELLKIPTKPNLSDYPKKVRPEWVPWVGTAWMY